MTMNYTAQKFALDKAIQAVNLERKMSQPADGLAWNFGRSRSTTFPSSEFTGWWVLQSVFTNNIKQLTHIEAIDEDGMTLKRNKSLYVYPLSITTEESESHERLPERVYRSASTALEAMKTGPFPS